MKTKNNDKESRELMLYILQSMGIEVKPQQPVEEPKAKWEFARDVREFISTHEMNTRL